MTYKELKAKYKGYSFIAIGVPLKDKLHCTPFTRLPKDKKLDDCDVVEYEVEDKEYTEYGIHFATMKPIKPRKKKGHVYVYVK